MLSDRRTIRQIEAFINASLTALDSSLKVPFRLPALAKRGPVLLPRLEFFDSDPRHNIFTLHMSDSSLDLEIAQHDPTITSALDSAGMATNSIKLLTGNSHPQLAKAVAER